MINYILCHTCKKAIVGDEATVVHVSPRFGGESVQGPILTAYTCSQVCANIAVEPPKQKEEDEQ